jgi:hypothetical protein
MSASALPEEQKQAQDLEKSQLADGKDQQGGNSSDASSELYANPTGIDEKALIRKIDWKLLPPLTLLYLLSFLDRSNGVYITNTLPLSFNLDEVR